MSTRYVLITGASKGIGRTTALHLDKLGFHVFAGVRKQRDADALRQEASDRLQPVILDVTNSEHIKAVQQLITETVGDSGLYGLINNAGVAAPAPIEILPLDDIRWVMEVNLIGGIALIQAFLPQIRQAQGRIITISSLAGRVSVMMNSSYSMSKYAIEAMTDALRVEVKKWGIEVISIQPGAIDTPIWQTTLMKSNDTLAQTPQKSLDLYQNEIDLALRVVAQQQKNAIPAQKVADAIEHALTANRPRTRYLVGRDARMLAFLKWLLPDRIMDRLFLSL